MDIAPINAPQVPEDFHQKLRTRFFSAFSQHEAQKKEMFSESICLFKGIPTVHKNYDDIDHVVEQESTFWYLFGVKEPDCYAVMDNKTGKSIIFVPRHDEVYKLWMNVKPLEEFNNQYKVQQVLYVDQLEQWVKDRQPSKIYVFSGVDSDSKISPDEPEEVYLRHVKDIDREVLWVVISNVRAIKTEDEIALLRYVCKLSTDAHLKVMKSAKAGLKQLQMAILFHFQNSIRCGCPHVAFNAIAASGRDCATLHYIENDKIIEHGQMLLHDMGGKWYGYCADQAVTFPVDGKFTEKQKAIYHAVYESQKKVLDTAKAGVNWGDMHLLAEKVILEHLIKLGIVNQFPMEELQQKRVGAVFFPHGLGHLLGLRTHDLGGYTKGPERSTEEGLKSLRTRRDLEEGMVITVEPGCYFIDFRIQKALADPELAKYLNKDKIEEYKQVGGVRLEDDVVIRKEGVEMLSSIPRRWEEVEEILKKE